MHGGSKNVLTKEIIPNKLIPTEWSNPVMTVDYEFAALTDNTTYVIINNYGFKETADNLIREIQDNTGGLQ